MPKTQGVVCLLLIGMTLSGCALSTQWSENFARQRFGTESTHPRLNDGTLETVASIRPKQGERVAVLTFPEVKPVRKIVVYNKNLFRFDLDYWDVETSEWKTVHQVREKRNVGNSRAAKQFVIDRLNFETHKIRLKVLQTVDDRIYTTTGSVFHDEKKINTVRGSYHGHLKEWDRVLKMAKAQVGEIEVYNFQPPAESSIGQTSTAQAGNTTLSSKEAPGNAQATSGADWPGAPRDKAVYPTRPTMIQSVKVTPKHTLKGHTEPVNTVAISSDGRTLVSGGWDETLRLWSVADRREIAVLHGQSGVVRCIAYHPDGGILASGHYIGAGQKGGIINLWSTSDQQILDTLREHYGQVKSLAFSSDGRLMVSCSIDNSIILWSVDQWQPIATCYEPAGALSVAVSPDRKLFASGATNGTIRLWSVDKQKNIMTLKAHRLGVTSLAFSPDGKLLASGGDDSVKLWDVVAGQQVATLKGKGPVAFSPDGELLATRSGGNQTKTIKFWLVANGQEISTLRGHRDTVTSLAFSPDGQFLASGSRDNTLRLWEIRYVFSGQKAKSKTDPLGPRASAAEAEKDNIE